MAEIEIGAQIHSEADLKLADEIVANVCAARGASVVASGAMLGDPMERDWTIEVGRSRRRQMIVDAVGVALRQAGIDAYQ